MKKQAFIANVAMMSSAMLAIRVAAMTFNIFISARIGAEGMGLYHLIYAVYGLAVTLSTSGINLAVTRLVSEQLGRTGNRAVDHIVNKCLSLTLAMSLLAAGTLFFGAQPIGDGVLHDPRAALSLRILAPSLPFLAISCVLRGYFLGLRKVATTTVSQMIEEFSGIALTIALLPRCSQAGNPALSLLIGASVSEALSCAYDLAMYTLSRRQYRHLRPEKKASWREILSISGPVAIGSYLRSGLVTVENVLIPPRLVLSGASDALARYGMIKGMAMQIVMFPAVFLQSFISLLVPEIAQRNAARHRRSVRRTVEMSCEYTLLFGCGIALCLLTHYQDLSVAFYKNTQVGAYIGALALLTIPLYLDSVVDGMLKGLNQQLSSLKYNICDSCLRVAGIFVLLPRFGMAGYVGILYASELFNLTLSLRRLLAVTGVRLSPLRLLVRPALCAAMAFVARRWLLVYWTAPHFAAELALLLGLYALFAAATGFLFAPRAD